jgi:hypothetical protein
MMGGRLCQWMRNGKLTGVSFSRRRPCIAINVLVMNDPTMGLRGGFCTVHYPGIMIRERIYKLAGLLLSRI